MHSGQCDAELVAGYLRAAVFDHLDIGSGEADDVEDVSGRRAVDRSQRPAWGEATGVSGCRAGTYPGWCERLRGVLHADAGLGIRNHESVVPTTLLRLDLWPVQWLGSRHRQDCCASPLV